MKALALFLTFLFLGTIMAQVTVAQIPYIPVQPVYKVADERIVEDWRNRGIVVTNPDGSGTIKLGAIGKLIEEGFYKETPDGLVFTRKGLIFYYIYRIRSVVRGFCP
ncbi:MAG: hypothetical protein SVE93_01300 [Candidatus Thermoplasmatota archaeon]|nr:hypothetical protein [Candidatus Thermoplasmatota archaeon]